jgi:hypothetical protein
MMQTFRTIIACLSFTFSIQCFSQKDTVFVNLRAPGVISEEKQFVFSINFKAYYKKPIQVALKPICADNGADFGDIKFSLQKLSSGACYETVVVDSDPFGIDLNGPLKIISYGDSVNYDYDIRNIYFMRKGVYRIKAYLDYSMNKKPLEVGSEWVYFEVKTDKYQKIKSL